MSDSIISWYSGYKSNEYPLSFLYQGVEKRVKKLIEEKVIEDSKTRIRKREFIVETENGEIYSLTIDVGQVKINRRLIQLNNFM